MMIYYTCTEHPSDIRVTLIETLLHYGVNKRRSVKEESLVCLAAVFFGHFAPAMTIAIPQAAIANFLNLQESGRYTSNENKNKLVSFTFKTL